MLEEIAWQEDGRTLQIGRQVCYSDHLPRVFRVRLEQLQAVQRWLAGYFHAAAILLQIPGGAEYQWNENPELDVYHTIWTRNLRRPVGLLAHTLHLLDASRLLAQVPVAPRVRPLRPPEELQKRLAAADRNVLLRVVAECLDRLLVVPHLPTDASLHDIEEPRMKSDDGEECSSPRGRAARKRPSQTRRSRTRR